MIIVYNIEEMASIPIVYRYAPLAYLDHDGQYFSLNGPDTVLRMAYARRHALTGFTVI